MTSRRRILLDALDKWRAEGLLDEPAHARLAERALAEPDDDLGRDATASPAPAPARVTREDDGRASAPVALQFVGGLLLGAAAVALVAFLELEGTAGGLLLLGIGTAFAGGAFALDRLARDGLAQAAYAAGLVAAAVAAPLAEETKLVAWLVMALGIVVLLARQGRGPTVVVAGTAYVVASAIAAGPELFDDARTSWIWMGLLLALLALLLVWRGRGWVSVALGLLVLPLTLGFVSVLMSLRIESSELGEVIVGVFLGALLALGLAFKDRGLATGAAAGLTIDAVVLAFDLAGPGTAVIVLLVLGGVLVWQAEILKRWWRGGLGQASHGGSGFEGREP